MRLFASVLFVGMVAVWATGHTAPPRGLHFETVRELRTLAEAGGFITANEGSVSTPVFFIANRAVTQEELLAVGTRRDCGMTPNWRGLIWVSQIRTPGYELNPDQLGGKWRVWGNVVVAGDEQMMNRLERYLHDQKADTN